MRLSYLLLYLCSIFYSATVQSAEPLSNAQLDDVTAGASNIKIPIQIDQLTSRGTRIVVEGDIQWQPSMQNYSLSLADNAQQNLSSLININAVNSPINVLLNLNINVDSTIGSIQQFNLLNGAIPPVPTP